MLLTVILAICFVCEVLLVSWWLIVGVWPPWRDLLEEEYEDEEPPV